MDWQTSAAVMVGLGAVGKPTADLVKDFLGRILAPTADAAGQALAHPIVEWQRRRIERAHALLRDAAIVVEQSGEQPQAVPGRVVMSILEKGSTEDEDSLREHWVNLLATAASRPGMVPPAFPAILSELTRADAAVLAAGFRHWSTHGKPNGWTLVDSPFDPHAFMIQAGIDRETEGRLVEDNLIRLRLLRPSVPVVRTDRYLGESFIEASKRSGYRRDLRLEEGHPLVTLLGSVFMEAVMRPTDL